MQQCTECSELERLVRIEGKIDDLIAWRADMRSIRNIAIVALLGAFGSMLSPFVRDVASRQAQAQQTQQK